MTSTPDIPNGEDLAQLRKEIDELMAIPEDELISPMPRDLRDAEPTPGPTDAIGSEKWDLPVSEESLDQE